MKQPFPFSNFELFRDVPEDLGKQIESMLVTRKLAKNETLFQKGDEGDGLYVIISGSIHISSVSSGGKEASFNVLSPGAVFGEIALLDGGERTADAIAGKASVLSFLPRHKFKQLLADEPDFAYQLIAILCGRLRRMSAIIEDFLLLDIRTRLARQLLNEVDSLQLSQENLSRFLGTSRVTVNKHLQEWKKQGWITLARGRVNVLNRAALENLIETRLSDYDTLV